MTNVDEVGELLRLVDAEPEMAIPVERTAHHRMMARAHWQAAVQTRTRRRRLFFGLAAAALLTGGLGLVFNLIGPSPPAVESIADITAGHSDAETLPIATSSRPIARVAAVIGSVHDRRSDMSATTLSGEAEVAIGALLETDAVSRAAFDLASGHQLRLDVDTRLRLVSSSILALERGAVYIDSNRSSASLEIRTPLGIARDIGTRFEVRLDERWLRVRVRDGVVEVARSGAIHEAGSGAELTLDSSGSVDRREVPLYGSQWQWSQTVAPIFDLEGRTLSEFLDWVIRETGWLSRIDPVIERGAAAVILSGSIEGLMPSEALRVVLPTTGLQHHVVDGILIVEPLDHRRTGERPAG